MARVFCAAPVVVIVVSRPDRNAKIPVFEQELSAGAVCMNLLTAAHAMGFGANWVTGFAASQRRRAGGSRRRRRRKDRRRHSYRDRARKARRAQAPGPRRHRDEVERQGPLVEQFGRQLAAIRGELGDHLLDQPNVHRGAVRRIASIVQFGGELLAR